MAYLGEAFEEDSPSSCTRLQLRRLRSGLAGRMLRPAPIAHAGPEGGWVPSPREGRECKIQTSPSVASQSAADTIMNEQ